MTSRGLFHECWLVGIALLTVSCTPLNTPALSSSREQLLATQVQRFTDADRQQPPAPCQILFVGSSSIVKWTTLAADMAPQPVINRGFGGSEIEDINRWFDQVVRPYRPRQIVFYAGENDIDAGKSVERVVADFKAFMGLKTRSLGNTPVYFISVKPSKVRLAELDRQHRVNEAIRAWASQRSDLHYIDVASQMLTDGDPKDLYVGDQLHMNPAGYVIWTTAVRETVLPGTAREAERCSSRGR